MKTGAFAIVAAATLTLLTPLTGEAAIIIWGTHEGAGATDYAGVPLDGIRVPGGPVNLANGALVQLIKSVGAVDNPFPGGVPDPVYWISPDYTVDDIILDEVHAGYGLGPPGARAQGEWSRTMDVDIEVGDVLYARAFNVPKADTDGSHEITIGRCTCCGDIVSNTVTQVVNPETYYFDNLSMVIPEPAVPLFVLPGIMLMRFAGRKKRNRN